jgi:hypothetical protein
MDLKVTLETILAGVGLLDIATFGILDMIVTEVLVRRLYFSAPHIWDAIGKPVGPIWTPPGTTVRDTFTIFERRLSISELLKRTSALPNPSAGVGMIEVYYRIHRIALLMILLGALCFGFALVMSFS